MACLQLLGNLQLDPARRELISGFIDAYLQLTMEEEKQFATELAKIEPTQQVQVMEIVTSWMQKGIEQGREEGREQGRGEGMQQEAHALVLRQLRKRLGSVSDEVEARIGGLSVEQLEQLGEALLDFGSHVELDNWLAAH